MVVFKTSLSTLVPVALLLGFPANMAPAAPDQATMDRCTQYAQRAVQQYLLMTSHPQCSVKPDLRWQDNVDNHYNGCLKLPEFLRASEEAARDNHLQACGAFTETPTEVAGMPATINETENTHSGVWTFTGGRGQAHWDGGGIVADLVVQRWDNGGVLIFRRNTANSSDPGLTAIYSGQISGNKIVNGYVIWKWKGFPKGVAQGTWNASW
jgi:hypothetical protein